MFISKFLMKYCESIGLKNYLKRLILPIIIVFVIFLVIFGKAEFTGFSLKSDGLVKLFQHIGYTILFSYMMAMGVPAVEDFIACRKNEIRPFFINVHTREVHTKVSSFEVMAWILRFAFLWTLSMTFIYAIPVSLLLSKAKNKQLSSESNEEI